MAVYDFRHELNTDLSFLYIIGLVNYKEISGQDPNNYGPTTVSQITSHPERENNSFNK